MNNYDYVYDNYLHRAGIIKQMKNDQALVYCSTINDVADVNHLKVLTSPTWNVGDKVLVQDKNFFDVFYKDIIAFKEHALEVLTISEVIPVPDEEGKVYFLYKVEENNNLFVNFNFCWMLTRDAEDSKKVHVLRQTDEELVVSYNGKIVINPRMFITKTRYWRIHNFQWEQVLNMGLLDNWKDFLEGNYLYNRLSIYMEDQIPNLNMY